MKKIYLSMILVCSLAGAAQAQLSDGGLPVSMRISKTLDKVNLQEYPAPDFAAIIKQQNADEDNGVPKPYMVSQYVNADITLLNSGSWTYLDNGEKIWRHAVTIPGAKAIDFFYDRFNLPEGVQLYLSNANGKQLLGAYTAKNNTSSGLFTNQAVQGDVAFLEMDIAADVPVSSIKFHINKMGAFYRGVGDLTHTYGTTNNEQVTPAKPTNENPETSTCHIDANCPLQGIPVNTYMIPKNATVRILIANPHGTGEGTCSGTLINNTGNTTSGICKPLLLTASHCDEGNNRADDSFAQWRFKFNYQYDSCGQSNVHSPTNQVIVGASFRARSNYPSMPSPPGGATHLVGDFLLLELNSSPPATYGAYLAGWNRNTDLAEDFEHYTFFIGFHHPHGDVKKKSWGTTITSDGQFNQTTVPATHWHIPIIGGGTQPGSSGSGLFDIDGLLVGDLSGGGSSTCGGASDFGRDGLYSKLSYGWDNGYDQTTFPAYAGAQSQLKTWLDPGNTGMMKLGPTQYDCSDMPPVGIKELENMLNRSINVYPNPSNTGIIRAKINLAQPANLKVRVYNALGALQKEFSIPNVFSGDYSFDCSDLSNGIYLINFSIGSAVSSKKIILNR